MKSIHIFLTFFLALIIFNGCSNTSANVYTDGNKYNSTGTVKTSIIHW